MRVVIYYMKKYLWVFFLPILALVFLAIYFLVDKLTFYFFMCVAIFLLAFACFIHLALNRNFAEKRREESKDEVSEVEKYVDAAIRDAEKRMEDLLEEKLAPLRKIHNYLSFLDEVHADFLLDNEKLKGLIEKYKIDLTERVKKRKKA